LRIVRVTEEVALGDRPDIIVEELVSMLVRELNYIVLESADTFK
jgi:hypothetical protein